tara:strand:- start:44844 stop:45953 length:1110 start_codon:yes stop_codon:yes gene_type:complete
MGFEFSGGLRAGQNLNKPNKNLYIAEVVAVGKLSPPSVSDRSGRSDEDIKYDNQTNKSLAAFNADEHAIRCVIVGTKFDGGGDYPDVYNLPNCFPLMPKHTNLVPKKGEFVIVMLIGDDERFNDRFYIGPIISSAVKLNKDDSINALANFVDGTIESTPKIISNGIYENKQNVVIEGRDNTDIIQRSNEVLIRAGKFKFNGDGEAKPLVFNNKNPGYIQIKSNFNYNPESANDFTGVPSEDPPSMPISVTNIVSDRINLLSYDGTPNFRTSVSESGLTKVSKRDKQGNVVANYIDDTQLEEILQDAHQLVFGDVLVEYLILMRKALLGHHHNRGVACDHDVLGESEVKLFNDKAQDLEKAMLSKNIRIN